MHIPELPAYQHHAVKSYELSIKEALNHTKELRHFQSQLTLSENIIIPPWA